MMKAIVVEEEHCLACGSCMLECGMAHTDARTLAEALQAETPPQSRVYVEPMGQFGMPLQCRHCEDAPCITGYGTARWRRMAWALRNPGAGSVIRAPALLSVLLSRSPMSDGSCISRGPPSSGASPSSPPFFGFARCGIFLVRFVLSNRTDATHLRRAERVIGT